MTMSNVVSAVTDLSRADKFRLVHHLLAQLAEEENIAQTPLIDDKPLPDDISSDPLFSIIGMADDGLGDVSERHDYYLYSTP